VAKYAPDRHYVASVRQRARSKRVPKRVQRYLRRQLRNGSDFAKGLGSRIQLNWSPDHVHEDEAFASVDARFGRKFIGCLFSLHAP
jgi:hypothetical protein